MNTVFEKAFQRKRSKSVDKLSNLWGLIKAGGDWKKSAYKANLLEDTKRFQEAIAEYINAIDKAGEDQTVYALYHQIGYCYLNLGNDKKASQFYTYAIDLKSEVQGQDLEGLDNGVLLGVPFKRMYNNRANAQMNQGNLNEALTDCQASLSYDKTYSNPYLLLAQIYSKAGNESEAIKNMKISAQLGNKSAKSYLVSAGIF